MIWRTVAGAVAAAAVAVACWLAFQAGAVAGDRNRIALDLATCRSTANVATGEAAAARIHAEEMNRQREDMLRRLGDQAAVVNDLGQQLDRLREGCPAPVKGKP